MSAHHNNEEEWACWAEAAGLQQRVQSSTQKHQSTSSVSVEKYLETKRAELAASLEGKRLIYLDTKHWVNLCHVVMQSSQLLAIYKEILNLLESLRQKERICCPVSASLFTELMKQRDISTRAATARIMDALSGGVCLQNWLDLARSEFGRHICRVFQTQMPIAVTFPIWTKIGYWAGEHTLSLPILDFEDGALLEKVYVDLRWSMTCYDYQAMPGWIPAPDSFFDAWVKAAESGKSGRGSANVNFAKEVRARRNQLLTALKDTIFPLLALCQDQPGTPKDHIARVLEPIYSGDDPKALPSLEVVAGLDAAIASDSTRKVQANDMEDYIHAAQSLPYSDALFCDTFMAQKLRFKPLEFGKIYKTEIGSRPEELAAYLKSLL